MAPAPTGCPATVPGPDALCNADVEKRSDYYGRTLRGTPTIYLNGIADKKVYMATLTDSAWSAWSAVPGGGSTDVALAATTMGSRLYLFGKGTADKKVYATSFNGSTWSGWAEVPGGGLVQRQVAGGDRAAGVAGLRNGLGRAGGRFPGRVVEVGTGDGRGEQHPPDRPLEQLGVVVVHAPQDDVGDRQQQQDAGALRVVARPAAEHQGGP